MGNPLDFILASLEKHAQLLVVGLIAIGAWIFVWLQEQRIKILEERLKAKDEWFKQVEALREERLKLAREERRLTEELGLSPTITIVSELKGSALNPDTNDSERSST